MSAVASKPAVRTYHCARCGRRLRDGKWIFSYLRERYCVEYDECSKRAKRKRA